MMNLEEDANDSHYNTKDIQIDNESIDDTGLRLCSKCETLKPFKDFPFTDNNCEICQWIE